MKTENEKIPDPKQLEKEIGEFLSSKFGGNVKVASPIFMTQAAPLESEPEKTSPSGKDAISFDLKPEELVAYLDQYIIKQGHAKAVLATKICTHFNRIKQESARAEDFPEMVGRIKNNVLMMGPTGVGKTYMIRLIAKRIGVPFVKGDATKFSETGYVGGDVEDLIRDLVREADDDIEQAQCGIIYIDEIDKIASSTTTIGADVSRTGVQRALLKPMEETEVDLKVAHDPVSMLQEMDQYRRTGKRDRRSVNTRNILFIMSGAFNGLDRIIRKRMADQNIGFGANPTPVNRDPDIFRHIKSEDLTEYGFESEFVGRLPIRAVFEHLNEEDLLQILQSPSNPIVLGKKLDFAAYGIDICFGEEALRVFAKRAFQERTGARGLVSAVENALLLFEKHLPSTGIRKFPIDKEVVVHPEAAMEDLLAADEEELSRRFEKLKQKEKQSIVQYLDRNSSRLAGEFRLSLTTARMEIAAEYYCRHIVDVDTVLKRISDCYDEVKKLELYFFKDYDFNIVLENDAIDYIMDKFINKRVEPKKYYKQLSVEFEHGLRLLREKTGSNRFFITADALASPDVYISDLIKRMMNTNEPGADSINPMGDPPAGLPIDRD